MKKELFKILKGKLINPDDKGEIIKAIEKQFVLFPKSINIKRISINYLPSDIYNSLGTHKVPNKATEPKENKSEYSDEVYDCKDILDEVKSYEWKGFNNKPETPKEGLIDDLYVKGLPLHNKFFLSNKDAETFFKAIDNPEPPNEELKRAAENYKDNSKKENK